jgi:alanyl-tRNA synthetase
MNKVLTGNEIREKFVKFFESKQHKHYESASLIPDDPTLLLTVAGMVPFKPYFLGQKEAPTPRVVTHQKCIRTNDLENVGRTARHHTFFEMLGNFSFGDYFKEEAIAWSWEFITEVLKLDPEKLWISVFTTDDEAEEIWNKKIGVPMERLVRLGEDDNWWSAGPIGSCGPCSEIHVDLGPEYGGDENSRLGDEGTDDRFIEIWNLVFTEYNRLEDGTLEPLPKKNIDTGAGLERVAAMVQKKANNYETDLIFPIIERAGELTNSKYTFGKDDKIDFSLKVISDHIRAIIFMVSDGILPSNEGRGYVLRRILRRAVRHGRLLGNKENFLYKLVDTVMELMGGAYPDIIAKKDHIIKMIRIEEEKFSSTLDKGIEIAIEEIKKVKEDKKTKLDASVVFKLYDTFGFPYELTEEICEEEGITISHEDYLVKMEEQRDRARSSREVIKEAGQDEFIETFYDKHGTTKFTGYETTEGLGKILNIRKSEDGKTIIIFDETPFYAESGGQKADTGRIVGEGIELEVLDVKKQKEIFMHTVKVVVGEEKLVEGIELNLSVDGARRNEIKKNHTATHLLHKALKMVLGDHIAQAGSLVSEDRLRFDFSHYEGVTRDQLEEVERIVNEEVAKNIALNIATMNMDEAKEKGATALFGDKYGSVVRVVEVPEFSTELCGGIHVERTGEIGLFNILTEGGIAAGVRRIEATTGFRSYKIVNKMERALIELAKILKTDPYADHLVNKTTKVVEDLKASHKEIEALKSKLATYEANSLFDGVEEINGVKVLVHSFKGKAAGGLREIVDKAKDKLGSCVVILGTDNGKAVFAVGVTKDLMGKVKAGDLVREIAKIADGNGGGRPDFAQAGGKNGDKVVEALAFGKKLLEEKL